MLAPSCKSFRESVLWDDETKVEVFGPMDQNEEKLGNFTLHVLNKEYKKGLLSYILSFH